MKFYTLLLLLIPTLTSGQINDKKLITERSNNNEILSLDLSVVFTQSQNTFVLGFIGDDYERFRIKFISVIKNKDLPDQYLVYGKNMVKDNVCEFQGTMRVNKSTFLKESGERDVKHGTVSGEYSFYENPLQKHVGFFKGTFKTDVYIDKEGKVKYDDLTIVTDEYSNNQFVGTWTIYSGKFSKPCNWGDRRIPQSGNLDVGTKEFAPNKKYLMNGWENYEKAFHKLDNAASEDARTIEKKEWWK